MDKMSKHVAKMEAQLDRWAVKLEDFAVKANDASAQAKLDAEKNLHRLKAEHHAARAKLDAAKVAGGDKWDDFKSGIEASWGELEEAFKKLGS